MEIRKSKQQRKATKRPKLLESPNSPPKLYQVNLSHFRHNRFIGNFSYKIFDLKVLTPNISRIFQVPTNGFCDGVEHWKIPRTCKPHKLQKIEC